MSIFRVAQMHDKFKFIRLDKPGFLKPELMALRLNFMLEELKETADACGYALVIEQPPEGGHADDLSFQFEQVHNKVDLEEALDGLIDLEVVLLGTADLMGFKSHVPKCVTSKYGTIWSEAFERVHKANMTKQRVPRGKLSKRGSSHDLIKPVDWKKPEFKDLLK